MEEEEEFLLLNFRSPKGRLIKLLEQKIKKPEIDGTLGKILDQFSQLTQDETTFLDNGIFHMNFAEDALLLESCGQYYGKCVDKLWDELLQFHVRMVKYDETSAKNCTDSDKREARKQEIAKLEERINRGKRKKIVLAEPENDLPPTNGCFAFDIDQEDMSELFNDLRFPLPEEGEVEIEDQPLEPFEHDFEIFDEWREISRLIDKERERNSYSVLVGQYHRLRYRMKHYSIPTGKEIVYDMNDPEEFNTREGRLISFHHIKHLFDYNDMCLLPDEDFIVSRLRIAFSLKKKWFLKNKIDPDAPYETYKEAWEKYEKEFFKNEMRKIQNMPQRNSEELMRFYKALARKEQLAMQKVAKLRAMGVKNLPIISFENVIVAPAKEGYDGIFDPYIPEDFDVPTPVLDITEDRTPNPTDGDHEAELSTLLCDLSNIPDAGSQTPDKPRSDSGYFDGGFEVDDESDHEEHTEKAITGTDTPFEFDKEANDKDNTAANALETATNPEIVSTENEEEVSATLTHDELANATSNETEPANDPSLTSGEQLEATPVASGDLSEKTGISQPNETEENASDVDRVEMNKVIKEFTKNASTDDEFIYNALKDSYFEQTDDMVTIVYNKPESDSDDESLHGDYIIFFGYFSKADEIEAKRQCIKKYDKIVDVTFDIKKSKRRKLEESLNTDLPPKRRKLSQKQLQMLKKSVIEPVKEQKWEHFFSLNYQVESGEGEVSQIDYDSNSEDEDLFNDAELEDHNELDVSGYHSDYNGSHKNVEISDRPESTPLPLTQDSGISVNTEPNETEGDSQKNVESSELQQGKPADPINSESGMINFADLDFLADFSERTGVPREELESEQEQRKPPELTPYEQEREKARERVAEWKEQMTIKLKKLNEHDFDIHEYGANIMNSVNVNEPKLFSEIVCGKSPAEVVRYFISSLQLANTLNVEICGAKQGELSNDTFGLKLLSKERYHEHFQEYQAPSEETLSDRLKKIKEIRMQNEIQKKQCTKRKAPEDQEYQPQSILKSHKSSPKSSKPRNSLKKIKILNIVNIVSPTNEKSVEKINTCTDQQEFNFQQPSTSWQADIMDQQAALESAVSDVRQTPTRISIDSGFMPSCDEDFLEQFDQLQHISDEQLQSTPSEPRKVLRVAIARASIN